MRTPLLRRIERYLKASGTSPTRFGREAVRDPKLVWDMRCGREPRSALIRRIQAHLDAGEAAAGLNLKGVKRCPRR